MKTKNTKHTERREGRKIAAGVIAALLVVVMGLSTVAYAAGGGDLMRAVASLFGLSSGVETYSVENADTVVDPDTTNDWTKYTRPDGNPSTQNVGRIWTDKSVFKDTYSFTNDNASGLSGQSVAKGDSDFLVSLSALSSMSNLKATTTSTTPLDIVLVLDLSGSMNDALSSSRQYIPVYDVDTNGWTTYYAQRADGSYVEVDRITGRYGRFDHWELDDREVEPMRYASDTQSGRIQFYTYQTVNQTKMDALKSAANQFIDSVGDLNQNVTDENDLSRIAIVKYADDTYNYSIGDDNQGGWYNYNYTQVVSDFSSDADGLKSDINGLNAAGGTAADYGLTMAQYVLDGGQYGDWGSDTYQGARDDAQKVVIFFTDGEPNHGSGFDDDVAATSVNTAHTMKQDGTTVYTIGVLNGADPSADPADRWTSDVNKYLHAVSSNYKDATAENSRGNASWDNLSLGDRTQDKDGGNANYYYAAEDSDQLNQVFEDITSSITENAGSGSPIVDNSTEGNTAPGNLTFTDQLGSYMQVTGIDGGSFSNTEVMKLVYGDQIYTSMSKETEGNVDTYHFEGTVGGNAVYGEADLADLTVTVTHGNDLATGDTVTVTIPASLIPLRNYDVDTDNGTMTVSQAYPVRLFYGVSLKDGVMDKLNDPSSDEYAAIIGSQASADKTKLDFYSNSFVKDTSDGSTTAEFTPNEGNKFYYYTSNTQLFLDEACSQPATRGNSQGQDTLYYKDVYWMLTGNGDEVREVTDGYGTVTRDGSEWESINWGNGYSDQAYVPGHTERADRPAAMTSPKKDNATGTAANVLNPAWVGGSVEQRLGNNGKLSLDMPGSLEIKKMVDWGNASDQTRQDKNSFTFEVSLADKDGTALTGSYPYYVNGSDESAGNVSNGGTITITGGQSVEVKGLPAGSKFTVTEQGANQNGFTTSDSTSQDGQQNDEKDGVVNGTIAAGTQISTSFTNTYHASDVNLNTNTTLKVQKNLEGRDWRDADSFEFTIVGFRAPEGVSDMPMPENRAITVDAGDKDNGYTDSFGDITFSTPGEYRYTIQENSDPEQPIAGINYSDAIYRVTVMVGDNGTGALTIDSVKIERMYNDEGTLVNTENEGEVVQGDTMAFKNIYSADIDTEGIQGKKDYDDTTGGNPFEGGKFTFQLAAQGGFETEGGSADDLTINADNTPMPDGAQNNAITTGNVGEDFTFPSITFDDNDVGNTYVYKVTEVAGNEDGMTYSNQEHTVMIKVEEVTDADGTHIVATVLGEYADPNNLVFKNTYDPTDAELKGDSAIHGTKTLTGRDMKDGEKFYFQLTQTSGPETILDKAEVVTVAKDNMQRGSADFNFADMTFTKTGTYTFTVNEVADANGTETADGSGMTYDTNIATVTVTVTDGNKSDNPDDYGKLLASVTYSNDKHSDTDDKALFANTYEASMNYGAEGEGGIAVTKQLTNRPMQNEEFAFSIVGTDSDTVTADKANAKLADADKNFKNTGAAANTSITMAKLQSVSFDQTDAGKTYSYIVDETSEDNADALPGVNCDQTQYRVDIQVVDNGDGTMHTLTTVTKIEDASGADDNEIVINAANSDAGDYAVPTFGFVNKYNPTPAEAGEGTDHEIQVTKTVTGAPSPDGVSYGFTLTATGDNIGNITGLDDNNQLQVSTSSTIDAGKSQTLDFGKLTFSKPGTYTFTVQEDEPTPAEGWTYDTTAKTVIIVVTDVNGDGQYDGKLYIQSVTGSPVKITNSYKPGSVIVGGEGAEKQITVQKSVTGADSTADFKFKIEPVNPDDDKWNNVERIDKNSDEMTVSITDDVTQVQSKTASFAGIQFNATGEYQFKITEVGAADFNKGDDRNGWTYDEHEAIVTVTVTDDNFNGQLDAAVSYDNTNATTDADKNVDSAAAFTNKYEATPAVLDKDAESGLGVQKTVTGAPNNEDFAFSAVFNADASAEKAAESNAAAGKAANIEGLTEDKLTVTISDDFNAGDKKAADFGTVTFKAAGIYVFDVTEDNEAAPDSGWTYDDTTCQITVTVTDNGKGALEAKVEGNDPEFTNSYTAGSVSLNGDSALEVTKVVSGAEAESNFNFTLTFDADAAGNTGKAADIEGLTDGSATVTADKDALADGKETVSFGDLTFKAAGDYVFKVTEDEAASKAPEGWTYDKSEKTITVHVTDEGFDGQLDIAADGGVEGNNPTFYNTYYVPEDAKSAVDDEGNDISGDMVGVGDVLTYTIDWVNNAVDEDGVPVNADVVITDKVPTGTTLVADSITEGGTQGQDGTITWTFKDQAPGASGQVSFKVKVTEEAAGSTVNNSAEIKIGENNPATSTVTNPVPGKEETTNPDKIGEGTVLTYQISFTNTDGDTASAEVVDTLTKGQSYNEGSATVQIGDGEATSMEPATTGDAAGGQTLTWNLADLPDNAEVVITFDVTVTRDAGASVDNTATVNGHKTNTTTTPYPSDSKKDVANADKPEISIDGKLAGVGDTLIYTIDWAAEADGTLTVTDKIPDGTAYVEGSADNDGKYDKDTNTITWTFEDRTEGDKGTVTFKVKITENAVEYDKISNQATLQIGDSEPTTTNEVTTDIPKKEVTDTTPDTEVQVGDTLTYTIEYRNDTDAPATVTVTDTLPAGLTYTGVPEGQTAPKVTTNDDGRQVLTWTFEDLEPSPDASIVKFNAVVNENATTVEDPVTNKAVVTVGDNAYDTNTTGDDVEVKTGDLIISKEIVLTEGQGTEIDADKEFAFTVTLKGTDGQPLTGTYQYKIDDGKAQDLEVNDEGQATLNLKHNESATITGLPEGAGYTVTEADYTAEGYTTNNPDNATGTITAEGVKVDFKNTYKPSGVIIGGDGTGAGITVQKTFTGRDWTADDSFEFTIKNTEKPESVETAPMPEPTAVTIGAEGAEDGMNSAAFGAMSFDTIGEYVYEITETHAGETIEGITYDAHTATVTVNVTDAGNGKLHAEVTYDNSDAETEADQAVENAAAFTNTYKPGDITIGGEDTQAGITVQKTLAGRAWEAKDGFEFLLKAVTEDAPMPVPETMRLTGKAGEKTPARAAFGSMTFTKDMMGGQMTKDFVYTVTETSTGGDGVTVDPSTERIVTVTVTDDGIGNLSAEVKYNNADAATTDSDKAVTDAAAFTNTYDAQAAVSVPANFTLTKVFEDHDWTEDYTFQFRLTPVDGAPMPAADENAGVTIADDGSAVKTVSGPQEDGTASFDFGAITYDTAGDYQYTVEEIKGDNPGISYSTNIAEITVHVTDKTDDGSSTGQLAASATVVNGTFTNTYKTGEVAYDTAAGLKIVKNMTGRAIGADEFTFTMTGADEGSIARLNDGKALEFKTTGAELKGNSASETINALTGLTFTQADVGQTYTYTVKETVPDGAVDNENGTWTLNGVTYDGTSYEVQFKVTEDGEGTLLVETFVDGESQGITQGAVATNALPAQLVFDNSYDAGTTTVGASGEAQIQAAKVLNNDDIANYAGQFHFSVTGGNNVKVASGTNDAAGNITFSDIEYNTENLNAAVTAEGSDEVGKATVDRTGDQDVYTFNYTVSEDSLDPESGVSYNGGTFGVTVTVTDDRAGKLTVAVAYDNGGDKLTFENTYGADSEFPLTLTGNKVIAAAEGLNPPTLTGGEYQFTIEGSDGAPMPETTTVSNQGATVSFGPITYTMENVFGSDAEAVTEEVSEDTAEDTTDDAAADVSEDAADVSGTEDTAENAADAAASDNTAADVAADGMEADGGAAVQTAGRTKVFTYTISESGKLPGVTNEEGTKTVEVTVTDMGGGKLTAAVTNVTEGTQTGSDFTFTNTYSIETPEESTPTGEGGVTITKTIDGRSLNEGEFTFQMEDAEGNVVSEGTNDAESNVELGTVTFDKPGTYSYTIREADNGLGGVTYDTSVYTATATVTDDQDGTLSVAWEVKAAGSEALETVTFANSYKAAPTSVSLGAAKRLDGRALKDGEFTFELKDEDGNVVSSAKNDENGAVTFDTISFDKAGTYQYTVTEAAGKDSTITYDDTAYTVTVTVTDDGNGNLNASVDTGDKALVFTNKYTKPAELQKPDDSNAAPADGTPKAVQTGDTTPIIPAVIAVIVSLAAIAAVVVIIMRRRRR